MAKSNKDIVALLRSKLDVSAVVKANVTQSFDQLAAVLQNLTNEYNAQAGEPLFRFEKLSHNVLQLTADADTLVFMLYSDMFQFDRDHDVWKTDYMAEDPSRGFSGIISIYNFVTSSIKYNRDEDVGYLVARVFVNKERMYFVEGKRQRGTGHTSFGKRQIGEAEWRKIVETALRYSIEFDQLAPPYEHVIAMNVAMLNQNVVNTKYKANKRLGFTFRCDDV